MTEEIEIMREARRILARPEAWAQGSRAQDSHGVNCPVRAIGAVRWCLVGAIERANPADRGWIVSDVARLLIGVCDAPYRLAPAAGASEKLVWWNDSKDRKHSDVLALLDRALTAAT